MRIVRFCFILFLAFGLSSAQARQDPGPVRKAIEDYLRVQTKGLPGQVSYSVGAIDPNNSLASCTTFDVTLPSGTRPWGRINVAVRCTQAGGWSMFVPAQIRIVGNFLIAARPLAQGQVLAEGDVAGQTGDIAELPNGVLTEPRQAIGRTVALPVAAGKPLRSDMLRPAFVIQQGQSVKVVSSGPGFQVANEGRALGNAAEGQVVQVRLASGQVLSGIARPGGIVDISY